MKSGIYRIVHWPTNRCYVGVSVNVLRRWSDHTSALESGSSNCTHLKRAWRTHGPDEFYFETLRLCDIQDALENEQGYIDLYDSISNGFNCSLGGGKPPMLGRKHSPDTIKKFTKANMRRVISPELRSLISKLHTGKKTSESLRKFRSERMKGNQINVGRKLTENQKVSLLAALKARWDRDRGKKQSAKTRAKISLGLKARYALKKQHELPL